MSFQSASVTTSGNNELETDFFQNFSRIFKNVSITGFETFHTAFTCSKKSSMLYLFQRVIRNRCKIDTNRASITNWGKIITSRGSSSCYKSGQFQLLQIGAKLLQIVTVITNWGRIITNRDRYCKSVQNTNCSWSGSFFKFSKNLVFVLPRSIKLLWKIYQNSQDIPVMESFRNKFRRYLAISVKIIPYHVFPWEMLINFQSKFFVVHLWLAASDHLSWSFNLK